MKRVSVVALVAVAAATAAVAARVPSSGQGIPGSSRALSLRHSSAASSTAFLAAETVAGEAPAAVPVASPFASPIASPEASPVGQVTAQAAPAPAPAAAFSPAPLVVVPVAAPASAKGLAAPAFGVTHGIGWSEPKFGHPVASPASASGQNQQKWHEAVIGTSCTSWRQTANCNPSGPRDALRDASCQAIITKDMSGYCECQGMMHSAAVPCGHPPFTCEIACIRHALSVSGGLTPEVEQSMGAMIDPRALKDQAAHTMAQDATDRINTHMNKLAVQGAEAETAIKDYMHALEEQQKQLAKEVADHNAAQSAGLGLTNPKTGEALAPWEALANAGKEMGESGREIQATVKDVIPFDPLNPPWGFQHA